MNRLIYLQPLIAVILTACSALPIKRLEKNQESTEWRQHQQAVHNLSQYQTLGDFAYISNRKKVYAHFFWQQLSQNNYRLLLLNPLGRTEIEIFFQSGQVRIVDNKGCNNLITKAKEVFLDEFIGTPILLNNLCYWIVGLPGNSTDYKLDNHYHLHELNYVQKGKTWKVIYDEYDKKTNPAMPSKMKLIKGNQYIKLKMNQWIMK